MIAGLCTMVAAAVGLHTATWHDAPGFETATPGAYVVDTAGCTAGALRNSEGRPSVYAGKTWQWGPLGLTVGAISGYASRPLNPLLLPSLKVGPVRIVGIPKIGGVSEAAGVHLAIEVAL